jgi:hypothetical protein
VYRRSMGEAIKAGGGVRRGERAERTEWRSHRLTAPEIAWIALPPCTVLAVAAIVVLGPPVGHLLFSPGGDRLWPPGWWETNGHREPVKHGRYVVATLAPALLFLAIVAGSRGIVLWSRIVRPLVLVGQGTVVALVAVALLEQHPLLAPGFPAPPVFGLGTVVAAAAIAGAIALVAALASRSRPLAAWLAALERETRPRRWASLAVAVGLVAVWLLQVPTTDALSQGVVGLRGTWTLNDAIAVLDGRTPLVDYHPIYAKLLPYPAAIALWTFGTTTLVYTTFMAVLAGLALLAVYSVFRHVTRSSLLALALFLPFVAASDIEAGNDGSPLTMAAMWPMRYGGAYLLAWLVVRHLTGRRPRRAWPIFFVAALVLLNNLEFGMGATVATAAALTCARPPRSAREVLRLVGSAAGGVLGAIAAVSLLTLLRAGALPDPGLLLEWPRIFTNLGWFSMPLRTWDLHLALYATFVAAIAVAAVRLTRGDDDVVLTTMVLWSGVFGLLASGYYVGRPDAGKLTALLSAWSFAVAMLTVVSLNGVASERWRPAVPRLLVLFGFALSICALSAFPMPQEQISRLREPGAESVYLPQAKRFVAQQVQPHEQVAILLPMSYRISYDLGVRNVAPYGFMNAIVTRSQFETLLDVLRRERVKVVFTPAPDSRLANEGDSAPQQVQRLVARGYQPVASEEGFVAFRHR